MNNFLNNILRYPRFFISSLIGLLLVILSPFRNLFKIPKFRFVLLVSLVVFMTLLYQIIVNMTGI